MSLKTHNINKTVYHDGKYKISPLTILLHYHFRAEGLPQVPEDVKFSSTYNCSVYNLLCKLDKLIKPTLKTVCIVDINLIRCPDCWTSSEVGWSLLVRRKAYNSSTVSSLEPRNSASEIVTSLSHPTLDMTNIDRHPLLVLFPRRSESLKG